MLYVLFNTIRNIGLGLFVNGLFLLQFEDNPSEAPIALIEGVFIMLVSGYIEVLLERKRK